MEYFLYRIENASKKGWAYDEQRLFDGIKQRKTSGAYIAEEGNPSALAEGNFKGCRK